MKRLLAFFLLGASLQLSAQNSNPDKDWLFKIETDHGTMYAIMFDQTPMHKNNFVRLTQEGFFDGTTFHRIIDGFMIQGGDPNSKDDNVNNDGMGGPGYTVPAEFRKDLKHDFGYIAAARIGGPSNPQKASSGSQFYIVENAKGTHQLDNQYTVFGKVIKGQETINKIAEQPKNPRDRPLKDIKMTITVKYMDKKKITKKTGYQYNK